jgi:hypothetical protein
VIHRGYFSGQSHRHNVTDHDHNAVHPNPADMPTDIRFEEEHDDPDQKNRQAAGKGMLLAAF